MAGNEACLAELVPPCSLQGSHKTSSVYVSVLIRGGLGSPLALHKTRKNRSKEGRLSFENEPAYFVAGLSRVDQSPWPRGRVPTV